MIRTWLNSSQLAKVKKKVDSLQDVKFGAISQKYDSLLITALAYIFLITHNENVSGYGYHKLSLHSKI